MIIRLKAEIRDPYCGGWVPIEIEIAMTESREIRTVLVKNADGFTVKAKLLPFNTDV